MTESILPKSKGRPRKALNPKVERDDLIIARSVYSLILCGFPMRTHNTIEGVAEIVAKSAQQYLNRADVNGLPLSADRIEQLFEIWFTNEETRRKSARQWPLTKRWRYTKESLYERCPNKTMSLSELCLVLIKNDGNWPIDLQDKVPSGDMVLAPKALNALGLTPKFKNNDEK